MHAEGSRLAKFEIKAKLIQGSNVLTPVKRNATRTLLKRLVIASILSAAPAEYLKIGWSDASAWASTTRSPASSVTRPDADKILRARALAGEGKIAAAEKLLTSSIETEKDPERRALMRMALAVILMQPGNNQASTATDQNAEIQFGKAIEDGSRIGDQARYYIGVIKNRNGQNKEARSAFESLLNSKTAGTNANEARYQIAQIQIQNKEWRQAKAQIEFLRKSWRGDERYPEMVFQLARIEKKLGNKAASCKWLRELYAKFPSYPALAGNSTGSTPAWGAHLENNLFEGEKTGCVASNKDLKTRVRRLWLSGEPERAATELKALKDETDEEGGSLVENLQVNHLLSEGQVDEALKILLQRYEASKQRPGYLLLLAKAASTAGNFDVAVSSYSRAYELAPRGKNGAQALFFAAFTSYQMQDYDGASRRFQQLMTRHPGSKFSREAQWYISWIQYLRGDYQGAYENFSRFAKAPASKYRRRGRPSGGIGEGETTSRDRLQYWSAMSLLKLGRKQEAIPVLQKLAQDPALGYYAFLAYYRLQSLPDASIPNGVATVFGLKISPVQGTSLNSSIPNQEALQAAAEAAAEEARAEYETSSAGDTSDTADASDSEDATEGTEAADTSSESAERLPTFQDPQLANKFERVRDLALVGLEPAARQELREIERRARSLLDRKLLMTELANIKNYDRSSFIGEVGFGAARLAGGLRGPGRVYWEYAYPRAWEGQVQQASRSTNVPEELIWAIMRAESHFRSDARSPVGARGLMQIMPFTGRKVADLLKYKGFEPASLLDPETNIRLGSRYLQRLLEKFSAKVPLIAAAYNAGPHRVHHWLRYFGNLDMDEFIEHIPYLETRNYVKRVSRNYQIYSLAYQNAEQPLRGLILPVGVQVSDASVNQEVW